MSENFHGQALKVTRIAHNLSQADILHELTIKTGHEISIETFTRMEENKENINLETFNAWCEILSINRATILKLAHFLEESTHRSGTDILDTLTTESDYLIWKKEHE